MANFNGKTGSTAWYEFIKQSGYYEYLQSQGEELPLPTHNYELLKEALEQQYYHKLAQHLAERSNNGFTDTPSDIARFRLLWLNDILNRNLGSWLNPTGIAAIMHKKRPSDHIELEKYKDYIISEIELAKNQINHVSDQSGLNKRHRILLHFYEGGKMLERKHKDYDDYLNFCSPRKRLAYSVNSMPKLKHLIKDIEIILSHLSDKARKIAEDELVTLKGRLTTEN